MKDFCYDGNYVKYDTSIGRYIKEFYPDHRHGGGHDDDDRVFEYRVQRIGIQGPEEDQVRSGRSGRFAGICSRLHGRLRHSFVIYSQNVQFRSIGGYDDRFIR